MYGAASLLVERCGIPSSLAFGVAGPRSRSAEGWCGFPSRLLSWVRGGHQSSRRRSARRAFALSPAMATPGGCNNDQSRSACESRSPAGYRMRSYYEIWISGAAKAYG